MAWEIAVMFGLLAVVFALGLITLLINKENFFYNQIKLACLVGGLILMLMIIHLAGELAEEKGASASIQESLDVFYTAATYIVGVVLFFFALFFVGSFIEALMKAWPKRGRMKG